MYLDLLLHPDLAPLTMNIVRYCRWRLDWWACGLACVDGSFVERRKAKGSNGWGCDRERAAADPVTAPASAPASAPGVKDVLLLPSGCLNMSLHSAEVRSVIISLSPPDLSC